MFLCTVLSVLGLLATYSSAEFWSVDKEGLAVYCLYQQEYFLREPAKRELLPGSEPNLLTIDEFFYHVTADQKSYRLGQVPKATGIQGFDPDMDVVEDIQQKSGFNDKFDFSRMNSAWATHKQEDVFKSMNTLAETLRQEAQSLGFLEATVDPTTNIKGEKSITKEIRLPDGQTYRFDFLKKAHTAPRGCLLRRWSTPASNGERLNIIHGEQIRKDHETGKGSKNNSG
jgi:hypothetical protein